MQNLFKTITVSFIIAFMTLSCENASDSQRSEQDGPGEPWASLELEIDGAQVVRSSESELQLRFPHIKPDKMNLPYAMITMKMKDAGWTKIKEKYGKEGHFKAPDGKEYGIEVFDSRGATAATIWRKN